MAELMSYLKQSVEAGASDVFIVAGGPVSAKIKGRIQPLGEKVFPKETEQLIMGIYELAGRSMVRFRASGDDDFPFAVPGLARFRASTYRQRGSLAAVIRIVSFAIPDWRTIHIPERVMALAGVTRGLVVVTGLAGTGKSTTQACIIDQINRTRNAHIITLEDPIEFLHRDQMGLVSQREISIDTTDYPTALRACLRQAPDVILLGEMRDQETVRVAMSAAETGHLVLTTLHNSGAVAAIEHMIDVFPDSQRSQARAQLGLNLHTVVSQQLLPDGAGGQVPAFELLRTTPTIRELIRGGRTEELRSLLNAGDAEGSVSMDQALLELYQDGKITLDTAIDHASEPERIRGG